MTHHEDQAASAVSIDPQLFQEQFDEFAADLAPLFSRREPRAHALDYLRGLAVKSWSRRLDFWHGKGGLAKAGGRLSIAVVGQDRGMVGTAGEERECRHGEREVAAPGAVSRFT
ncbi:hypothetical protein [Streptomyces sp. NPDC050548]|uniref:hypothetical protein n=1 Tax=Streptomyces sp. NPDC050548 TaxID=3365629 RepID=UPI0037B1423F